LYLPLTSSKRTAPFDLNSQTVASEPDMRHLPTTLLFPQAAIANAKTADAIILKADFDRENRTRMELRA
jgi:hypothetical protein